VAAPLCRCKAQTHLGSSPLQQGDSGGGASHVSLPRNASPDYLGRFQEGAGLAQKAVSPSRGSPRHGAFAWGWQPQGGFSLPLVQHCRRSRPVIRLKARL